MFDGIFETRANVFFFVVGGNDEADFSFGHAENYIRFSLESQDCAA